MFQQYQQLNYARTNDYIASYYLLELAPVLGLEPRRTVLETVMLPLHHTDMAERIGVEPIEPFGSTV